MLTLEQLSQNIYSAAIANHPLRIRLKGEPLPRIVHPHGICTTKRNQIVMVCWQSMGFTRTGGREGFRNIILTEVEELEVLESHFRTADGFNPADPQYKEWVFHL